MNAKQLICAIENGAINDSIISLSGKEALEYQKSRYLTTVREFAALYGDDREITLYSVSGRSELSGNHTDHNHGCVIAASIDLDVIAAVSPRDDSVIRLKSEGFPEDTVDIKEWTSPDESRFGSSASLIAGMAEGFRRKGYAVGGFDAYTTSNVLKGSGLSSSAAFEDMIGNILNHLYNGGKVSNVEIAKLAQFSENVFFGKPCGLMDQVACAVGGIVAIDFSDTASPVIEQVDFDLSAAGYRLCIVNTGGNHADLTDDYAAVPREMKAVASHFGKTVLRECDEAEVIKAISALRKECGDRAILRALHFFGENKRVAEQKEALKAGDLDRYFDGVKASGRSSFCYLQNVYTTKNVSEQGLSLALCLAEQYLSGKKAAFRVHGGGFAGTIQAYVPGEDVEGFRTLMDSAFGDGACVVLRIRPRGAVKML
ncbi:MAG: galactokinase [Clostridia bacterium]|nr:galactokinase [Clostridia bacterium]MBR2908691.1 galactokinase [Clostridia bacterium]